MASQLWLADAPRAWGLQVTETNGWQDRGSSSFGPGGLVAHHTAGPAGGGDMPSLNVLINGRSDLPGPLCNWGLGRSGMVYVVASGKANHAGNGGWRGLSGNSSVLGIEAENDGYQPWPQAQLDAYATLIACACDVLGFSPDMTCRHHEWRAEKPDPHDIDGDTARATVTRVLADGPLGGNGMPGNPAVVWIDASRWTFVRGTDGKLWWSSWWPELGNQPQGWTCLEGDLRSGPTAAVGPGNRVDVQAVGGDGAVWQRAYVDGEWTPWQPIGGLAG